MQYEVERALTDAVEAEAAKGGTAVIADVRTGDILAMATVDGSTNAAPAHPAAASDPNRPLTDVFEPGSTNKVVTIAAALEAGLVNPNTVLQVPSRIVVDGQKYDDVDSHPTSMTVADIVRESSNVGTIEIAKMVGKQRFDGALRSFGFGSPTGLGFPGEASGILLPLDQYNATSMASMPIGSGIAVTARRDPPRRLVEDGSGNAADARGRRRIGDRNEGADSRIPSSGEDGNGAQASVRQASVQVRHVVRRIRPRRRPSPCRNRGSR
jgi:cell division protein FtsI (penicillin-binding protein 3)